MYNAESPSKDYLNLIESYKRIHSKSDFQDVSANAYNGWATLFFADFLKKFIEINKCKTLLDYGSGKGQFYFEERKFNNKIYPPMSSFWNIEPTLYDPCVHKYEKKPKKKFDIVISIDVLEHIPSQDLAWVIEEIFSFSNDIVFINVACYLAGTILDDGRNAHVTVLSPPKWHDIILKITKNYNLRIFLTCSYYNFSNKSKKIEFISYAINDDFNNYK